MQRMKTLPLPRYVDPASVSEGDTIRVTWKVGDVEHTRTGTVERIERRFGWIYYTPQGNEIAHVMRSGVKARVTLLAEAKPKQSEALFDMENTG